ncbi:MAG: alpha/beta hydrolase fold domain-containing protein [Pseudomonadales bacterium]|nr:alpha/beta hydrolase fold domain-containing protein [Pseudomonadales bacterium]
MAKVIKILISVSLFTITSTSFGQRPVSVEADVIFSRVDGAAVLADIGYPTAGTNRPAIIYVHGGRWRAGDRNYREALDVAQWAGMGYFAMTIDYRLVGSSPAPAPYQDLQTAIRWVHGHTDEYSIDPDRIYLIGDSSGGHLVALAATLGEGPYERVGGWEDERSDIRAAISVAGPYELNTLSWGDLWTPLQGDLQLARRIASPMHNLGPNTKPILVIHSDDDRSVPIVQAVDFVAAMEAAGVTHDFVHFTDRGHMRITQEVVAETRSFINALENR